jgi:type VI secretion system protein ImpM
MSASIFPDVGFYGKLPSRGDFVRAGLPKDFVAAWDVWCQRMMAESQTALGEKWEAAWLQAPVWRFALPPGGCGDGAALGVWLPSVDSVGRYFPLTIALVASCSLPDLVIRGGRFLEHAEQAGRDALEYGLAPDELARRADDLLRVEAAAAEDCMAGWWTEGAPDVAPAAYGFSGLPDAAFSIRMLADTEPVP